MTVFFFFLSFAFSAYTYLATANQRPPGQKPAGLDEYKVPSVDDGRPKTWRRGTVLVKGPHVIGYANLQTVPIKQKAGK